MTSWNISGGGQGVCESPAGSGRFGASRNRLEILDPDGKLSDERRLDLTGWAEGRWEEREMDTTPRCGLDAEHRLDRCVRERKALRD